LNPATEKEEEIKRESGYSSVILVWTKSRRAFLLVSDTVVPYMLVQKAPEVSREGHESLSEMNSMQKFRGD